MSSVLKCDCCGKTIGNESYGSLIVHDLEDGYNTDPYDVALDICSGCLMRKFEKDEIMRGRTEI